MKSNYVVSLFLFLERYLTCTTLQSVTENEIEHEMLVDGIFVNTPKAIINEWMEKSLMVENPETESLPSEFKLKNQRIIFMLRTYGPE